MATIVTIFLFIAYLFLCTWVLTKSGFIKRSGLSTKMVVVLFILKVGVGCLSGAIVHQSMKADTWGFHRAALKEYLLFNQQPMAYCTNLFTTGYSYGHAGFLQTKNSYWNDLKDNLIVKFISVLHVFSGGRYYVNVILYNFLLFFGFVALYRVYKMVYPTSKNELIIGCFLLPSCIFFTSTIHKEGVVAAAIGIIVYNVYQLLYGHTKVIVRLLVVLVSLLLLLFLRNYILLALLPAFVVWYCLAKLKANKWAVSLLVYIILLFCFFNVQRVFTHINLVGFFVQKQADFLALDKGNTTLPVTQLTSTAISFISTLPQAINHSICRPYITDYALSVQLIPFAIELIGYQMLLLLCICFYKKPINKLATPFILVIFGCTVLIIIGYIVPAVGEIVRYRSLYLPFIIIPILQAINWQKLQGLFNIKK
jgi:hypothetical protein